MPAPKEPLIIFEKIYSVDRHNFEELIRWEQEIRENRILWITNVINLIIGG